MTRDRTTVRRALLAGTVAWGVVSLPLLVAVAVRGGSGQVGLAVVLLGLTVAGLVASAWLLLAVLLDLLAGEPPSAARLLITAGVVLLTGVAPVLFLAAGG